MQAVVALLGVLAVCACFAGWFLWLNRRFSLPVQLVPVVAFSGLIGVLFAAGLLNLLPQTSWAVLLVGVVLLCWQAARAIKEHCLWKTVRLWLAPGLVFFVVVLAFGAFRLRGASLYLIDDFTHWAAMVKEMTLFDRLPNFDTRLIYHQNYPPGTSLFVYFIVRFTGFGDARLLLAQVLLYAAALCALFHFIPSNWRGPAGVGFVAVLGMWLLGGAGEITINSLLVDSLIALYALVATLIIWNCRNDVRKAAVLALPVMLTTLLIKSSGILFVLLCTAMLLWLAKKQKTLALPWRWTKQGWALLAMLLLPYVALLLWNAHVDLVYPDAAMSRHAMRLETIEWFVEARGFEAMGAIAANFIRQSLSVRHNLSLAHLLAFDAALLLMATFLWKPAKKTAKKALLFVVAVNGVYVIYMAGLLATYALTMWYDDLTAMPAYSRYCSTITVYVGGLCGMVLLRLAAASKDMPRRALAAAVSVLFLASLFAGGGTPLANTRAVPYAENTMLRLAADQAVVMRNYGYDPLDYKYSFLVYLGDVENQVDPNLFMNMLCYNLLTRNVELVETEDDLEAVRAELKDYYFLLVLDPDERISAFLEGYGVAGTPEPFYLMEDLLAQPEAG